MIIDQGYWDKVRDGLKVLKDKAELAPKTHAVLNAFGFNEKKFEGDPELLEELKDFKSVNKEYREKLKAAKDLQAYKDKL